jgi:hypothetical protein
MLDNLLPRLGFHFRNSQSLAGSRRYGRGLPSLRGNFAGKGESNAAQLGCCIQVDCDGTVSAPSPHRHTFRFENPFEAIEIASFP